ncbi:MAG: HU-CCDC81 and SPOR domain-containing protein [Flavobacteriaceae bacterium]|nr:SPOR domain-containing protein [Bacteroidia bacterium]NNK88354.1 HU-CCDC81 and SPOR domain-containing protein [Flavobacteriaceae bacterium]
MQIDTYISDLLYRYECVIIPEFGAFLTRAVSAEIDRSSNTFYPPTKVVSFNEQLKNNDGLLANYIASVEKIPFELASQRLSKRIKALKSYLAQGETLTFKNIGEISLNSHGNLSFEPDKKINYLTASFGLQSFTSPDVLREIYNKEVEAIESSTSIHISPEKRKARPFLRYAAIAVIAIGLASWFGSDYYLDRIDEQNQIAEQEAQQQLENRIQEATFIIDNPLPAVTLEIEKQTGNYHIVAGAFRFEENCEKKLNELKSLGYHARRIGANKYGLHQVVYSSFETRADAQRMLYKIRREHNRDAWLLIQELD